MVGGGIFLVSDTALAFAKFRAIGRLPTPLSEEVVMTTYYAALACIALSVAVHADTVSLPHAHHGYAVLEP